MLDATAHLEKLTWVQILRQTGMKRNKCMYQLTVKMQCTSFWLPKWDTERMESGEQDLLVNVLCINNTKNNTQLAHTERKSHKHMRTHTHIYVHVCAHTCTHTHACTHLHTHISKTHYIFSPFYKITKQHLYVHLTVTRSTWTKYFTLYMSLLLNSVWPDTRHDSVIYYL
jgi:hypothetical protein